MQLQRHHRVPPFAPCDFCVQFPNAKGYTCRNFSYEDNFAFGEPLGVLLACQECSELIDLDDWDALTDRAFEAFLRRSKVHRTDGLRVRLRITDLHRTIREHLLLDHFTASSAC